MTAPRRSASRPGSRPAPPTDFAPFRDALAQQVELRHRYVACFDGFAHPYDALLDDFEPGLTDRRAAAAVRRAARRARAARRRRRRPRARSATTGPSSGEFDAEAQRVAVLDVLEAVGFDPDAWRLDPALHPFASGIAPDDVRLTTRYDEHDFAVALYSALHEFGHGLYEAQVGRHLLRTTLDDPVSLGVHESQSRMWENLVGRSRPFCAWLLPRVQRDAPRRASTGSTRRRSTARSTRVQPSLIRTEADETTYNLHIILRFELELGLIEGSLAIDDVPDGLGRGHRAAARPRGPERRSRASCRTSTGAAG